MPFCPNCGSAVEGRFCPKCGTAVGAATASGAPASGTAYGTTPVAPAAGGLSQNAASALSYVFFAGIFFILTAPYNRDRVVRFHAFQGLYLFGVWVALWIVSMIMFAASFGGMFFLWAMIRMLIGLGLFIIWLIAIIQASQGKRFVIPVIGPMAEKQAATIA